MKFFDFGEIIGSDTEFVFFGIPWDTLSSLEIVDSSNGPQKIREISENLALTTEMGTEIPNLKVVDIGNVFIDLVDVEKNIQHITEFVKNIFNQKRNVIPIMVGGDHFCTYPVLKVLEDNIPKKDEFGVIIFDAHLDFYDEYDDSKYSHASVVHRVYDLKSISKSNLIIVGTRDIDIPERNNANKNQLSYLDSYMLHEVGLEEFSNRIINFFNTNGKKDIYISIDIDVFDPSIAPGTGYAIPGGFTYRELWRILRKIVKHFNVIGFDVVEVSPSLDLPNNITANLAAKLIIELISFISFK